MPDVDGCPHDPRLTPASCTDCMYEGNVVPSSIVVTHTFKARREGPCARCDQPIVPGEIISALDDGTHIHYRHAPKTRRP